MNSTFSEVISSMGLRGKFSVSSSYCSFQIHGSIYNWIIVPGGCPNSTNIAFSKYQAMFLTAGVLLMEDNSL